jgi:hypothetical protein
MMFQFEITCFPLAGGCGANPAVARHKSLDFVHQSNVEHEKEPKHCGYRAYWADGLACCR